MSSEAPVPAGHSGTPRHGGTPRRAFPVRASDLLKVRAVWILPLVLGSVVVLITAFYVGSVVDPLANLHGLPVTVVNQDRGAMIGTQQEQAWPPACCSLAWRRSHARSGDSSRLSYPPLRRPTR
jgi:hypothetical protein